MTTPLTITSHNQGQVFGARPSMEDVDRQLNEDASFRAFTRICDMLSLALSSIRHSAKRLRTEQVATQSQTLFQMEPAE